MVPVSSTILPADPSSFNGGRCARWSLRSQSIKLGYADVGDGAGGEARSMVRNPKHIFISKYFDTALVTMDHVSPTIRLMPETTSMIMPTITAGTNAKKSGTMNSTVR